MIKTASNSVSLLAYRKEIEVSGQKILAFAFKLTHENRLTCKMVLWKAIELMAREMDSMEQNGQRLVQPIQSKKKEKKGDRNK